MWPKYIQYVPVQIVLLLSSGMNLEYRKKINEEITANSLDRFITFIRDKHR